MFLKEHSPTHPQNCEYSHQVLHEQVLKETFHLQQPQHRTGHMKNRIAHSLRPSNSTNTSQLIHTDIIQVSDVIMIPKLICISPVHTYVFTCLDLSTKKHK